MIEIIYNLDPIHLMSVSFFLGCIVGVMSTLFLRKNNVNTEKTVSLLVILMWLTMHTVAFVSELSVSTMFDFIGFGAAGNIMGLNFVNMAKAFKK